MKLNTQTKLTYGFGQLAEGIKNSTFGLFLLFYYNQVLGVSGTLCGIAMVLAMCVDAFTDPIIGSISDRWHSRYGRRHPFIYLSALPLAIGFYLLFNPMVEGEFALFIWLLCVAVGLRIMLTFYHVPHLALGAELSSDYQERTTLVALRNIAGSAGSILVYVLGFGVFFAATEAFPNGQLNQQAYQPFTLILAACMFVSVIVMALGTQKAALELPQPTGEIKGLSGMFRDLRDAMRNRSFLTLACGFIVISVPIGIGMSLALYLNTFFWQIEPQYMSYILAIGPIATMIGFACAPMIARVIEKKDALIWGATGWTLFAVGPVIFYYFGMFPEKGTSANIIALIVCHFLAGLLVSQLIVAIGSMLADVADEHDHETGKRSEGVFFGAYAFIIKATAGIGVSVSGFVLDAINWPVGGHVKSAADIPPDSLFALSMIAGPFLALGVIPSIYFFSRYKLTRARHAEIVLALAARQS